MRAFLLNILLKSKYLACEQCVFLTVLIPEKLFSPLLECLWGQLLSKSKIYQMLCFQNTETSSIFLEILVSLKFFFPRCASCVIAIKKYNLYPPCFQTGCMGFPLLVILLFLLTMLLPLNSWIFFPFCIFATSYALCPVKSIFNRLLSLITIFHWVPCHQASMTLIQIYLTSLCENF